MPKLGIGTAGNTDPDGCRESVRYALEIGYRHIDTARKYGNEGYVGDAISASDVDRENVFLATKVVHHNRYPTPVNGTLTPSEIRRAVSDSLDRLGTGYLNLLYVHWPTGNYDAETVLPTFDSLVEDGTIHNVGVSNFQIRHLQEARRILDAPIVANQVEMHPLFVPRDLLADAQEHDYWLVAYSPFARGAALEHELLQEIGRQYDSSAAQIALAWLLSKDNVAVIPKSAIRSHLRDNLRAWSLELAQEDIKRIDALPKDQRVIDPEWAPW